MNTIRSIIATEYFVKAGVTIIGWHGHWNIYINGVKQAGWCTKKSAAIAIARKL